MSDLRTAAQQALEALERYRQMMFAEAGCRWDGGDAAITALRAALAQQDEPEAYGYASRLAVAIWDKHYKDTAPQWKPLDDLMGVLTQIDNMTSGLTLLAKQDEPVEDVLLSAAGLALDALEHDRQAAARAGRSISMLSLRAIEELRGVFRAALAQQDESETCTWHQDGDSDSGVYATSCRHYFNLEDGTPEDNKMQWCCYCGKKLVQELITEDGDE